MQINAIVAGAGIWGCTVARRLAEAGKSVLVLEKRPVVGGNVRCEIDSSAGIKVHTYGSHIFHTQIPEVAWLKQARACLCWRNVELKPMDKSIQAALEVAI